MTDDRVDLFLFRPIGCSILLPGKTFFDVVRTKVYPCRPLRRTGLLPTLVSSVPPSLVPTVFVPAFFRSLFRNEENDFLSLTLLFISFTDLSSSYSLLFEGLLFLAEADTSVGRCCKVAKCLSSVCICSIVEWWRAVRLGCYFSCRGRFVSFS